MEKRRVMSTTTKAKGQYGVEMYGRYFAGLILTVL